MESQTGKNVHNDAPPIPEKINIKVRPLLRKKINDICINDDDLNAFALDYFPSIHRQFSGGMTREAKLNLLLEDEHHLTDIERAIEQIVELKSKSASSVLPQIATTTFRPRHGKQEANVMLDIDFEVFTSQKSINLTRLIGELYQHGYQVTIRDCKPGSVVVKISGSWQTISRLITSYEKGEFSFLGGYRVISIALACRNKKKSLNEASYKAWRRSLIVPYLLIGWVVDRVSQLAELFHAPKWIIVTGIALLLSGTAWGTGALVRSLIRNITQNINMQTDLSNLQGSQPELRNPSYPTMSTFPPKAIKKTEPDLKIIAPELSAMVPDLGAINAESSLIKNNEIVPNVLGPPGILITKIEYNKCQMSGHCPLETHHYEFLAYVGLQSAHAYCKWIHARLPSRQEVVKYGGQREWNLQDMKKDYRRNFFWCIK